LVRSGKTPHRVVLRARIVLGGAAGRANHALARDLGISQPTLLRWRQRYVDAGVAGLLKDARGRVGRSGFGPRRWKRSLMRRCIRHRPTRRRGACGRWPSANGSVPPRCIASGKRTISSRIARNLHAQSRSRVREQAARRGRAVCESARASAGAERHEKARSRRSIGRSRSCPCAPGCPGPLCLGAPAGGRRARPASEYGCYVAVDGNQGRGNRGRSAVHVAFALTGGIRRIMCAQCTCTFATRTARMAVAASESVHGVTSQ
jgi:Homeodomain-like domain